MVAVEFLKDNQKIEISYNGKINPKKDGFIIRLSGYDYAIGNKIIGFFDLGKYKNLSKKKFKKVTDPYKNSITCGFSYLSALDVIDFYKKCVLDMNISMIEEYNKRINEFDFFITIK